jgi:2-oxo-hept-3-ene-1,7-dioate hydratase
MTPEQIVAEGEALFQADATGQQRGLISIAYPDADLDAAYAIKVALVACKLAVGRRRIGWKIGLTSRAMREALKITTPDSGGLLDDMLFADGFVLPKGRFIQPRVEAEIACVMGADLAGPAVSRADVIGVTRFDAPCLEILETRIPRLDPASGAARTIVDTIADNAGNAGVVLAAVGLWICAGWGRSSSATVWSSRPVLAPAFWTIR